MTLLKRIPKPVWFLLFLSPAVGELLSGSAPPAEFFHPVGLIFLMLLYGGGAVLCRELTFRWGKGWPTLLLLGAAYGVIEEGLVIASFFNPDHGDLGPMKGYDRWLGVNWFWTLDLTIYHAVISIAVPVVLVSVVFPRYRERAWLNKRAFNLLAALFILNAAVMHVLFVVAITGYRPPLPAYLAATLLTIFFFLLARRIPHVPLERKAGIRPFWLGCASFLATLAFFLQMFLVPATGIPLAVGLFLMVASMALTGVILLKMIGRDAALGPRQQLALACGPLILMSLMAAIQQMDNANRPDNTGGMALVGLCALLFLGALAWRVRRRERAFPTDTPNPSQQLAGS